MMSPGDVWEATIKDGKIYSADDSNWGELNATVEEGTGYVEFFVLAQLNNEHPAVKEALQCSNYSDAYKKTTVDVCKIEKDTLKTLFVDALGGENIASQTAAPDLTYVVEPRDINDDAIGGFVRIESVTNGTFSTSIPLFAFENAREGSSNINGNGFIPGDVTKTEEYVNETDIRNLLRYDYVSIPYNLENGGDTRVTFTFILDEAKKRKY